MSEAQPMARIPVAVHRLPHGEGLPLPIAMTAGAAGADLVAALPEGQAIDLAPLARAAVPTGLVIALPAGWEAQIRPRSGLALKAGVTVLNAPGTIDADYRGEVMVLLINLGAAPVRIARGERIAQLVLAPVTHADWTEVASADALPASGRGAGGFGSTGGAAAVAAPGVSARVGAGTGADGRG